MALATVCPHCKTTFRVAADQLKLRGGIVRCGTCREIFDGNASLVDLDAPPPKGIAAIPDSIPDPEIASPGPEDDMAPETIFAFEAEPEPAEPKPEPEAPSASAAFDEQIAAIEAATPIKLPPGYVLDFDLSEPVSDPVSETSLEAELEDERDDDGHGDNAAPAPSLELSVADDGELSSDEPEDWPCPDELEKPAAEHDLYFGPLPLVRPSVIAPDEGPVSELPAPEPREVHPEPEADEPEFVRLHREKEQAARRRRLTMGAGSVLLMLVLLAQGVSIFRNVLAARYPALTPALAASCKLLRCKIELPAQIETMVLDTGELQSLGANKFQLTTLLRNEGTLTQAWPYLELELTDAADKALVRRVFTPAQFLPASVAPAKGFAGRSEQQVKIVFELKQLKASGFHIAVFYP
ncbi:DUF3426 domain-containing protein [Massilia sp. TSP1-1-2]|uniref:DUF3426 domain-containing protein n=1 Tax=Massilia sp. TSP1-1-2 TaxID=2804649 RepID=UPI003CEF8970